MAQALYNIAPTKRCPSEGYGVILRERTSATNWRDVAIKKDQIKRFLQKSGVPLETRALHAVRAFCKAHENDPLRAHDLGPVLWREDDDKAYREVDAAALLREVQVFKYVQVVTEAYYFVEAKYREGVEWFAFDITKSPILLRSKMQTEGCRSWRKPNYHK